jgi:lipoic acid synthetase
VERTRRILEKYQLNTVCTSAHCPNTGECFAQGTATFLIMGDVCTRSCRFCAVPDGKPLPLERTEPERIAAATREMGLQHVVVTSVTRDDLEDGGAAHFLAVISELKRLTPRITVEVLVPDFMGREQSIRTVVDAGPDVFNHNVETVPSLYPEVRPQASYRLSLAVLKLARQFGPRTLTKSGLMVGLGESKEEIESVMTDLRRVDCDILTIGQYLAPSQEHLPVVEFIEPAEFDRYRRLGRKMGFRAIASGPFVRSSHNANEVKMEALST